MAPSRRKGANKAAAAAAARRKWKVGDLVLAKVKGFPAWPATVSEPEKWGYPVDWKKVMVHFFGTEQIAFCNPIDVEEFTEEKKLSLLGKRHGKGADFVRAVNEIIDCFEKLKSQDQVSSVNLTEETNITNENNSEESLTRPVEEDAPVIAGKPRSTGTTNDLNSLTEAAVAAAARDALHDDEMQLEAAHSNLAFTETPVSTTYSTRSKTNFSQSRKSGTNRRVSARRLRSSSRVDGSRRQKLVFPSMSNTRSSRRSATNALPDRSLRRSKRIMKSSDDSDGHDIDSPASLSNDSVEENDSEIMTVDSDAHSFNDGSLNDGSTVDSGCKPVGMEPFSENNDGETELSDRLEFQANAVVIKKKRKPNRKRHHNDTVVAAKLDIVVSEPKLPKNQSVSPGNNKKILIESCAQDNGDEHLPLVKRARVRMGRPIREDEDSSVCKEEKPVVASESIPMHSSGSLNCEQDAPADRESFPGKGDPSCSSVSHVTPPKKPQFWDNRKNFADGEAALPPSKRLHRALEAMSANVAEDSQRASTYSPIGNTHSNGHSSSFVGCSEPSMGNKAVIDLGSGPAEDHSNGYSESSASECRVVGNVELAQNDAQTCNIDSSNVEVLNHSVEQEGGANSESLGVSMLDEHPAGNDTQHVPVELDSPNVGEEMALVNSDCYRPGIIISPTDRCEIGRPELEEVTKGADADISLTKSDSILIGRPELEEVAKGPEVAKVPDADISLTKSDSSLIGEFAGDSLNIDTNNQIEIANVEGHGTHGMNQASLAEINQNGQRSPFIEEARSASMESNVLPSAIPVKILTSGQHQSLLHSGSMPNDHQEDRTVSVTQSSCSTDVPESVARASPPSSSIRNISAPDNTNTYLENNSSCSPGVQLHLEKAKLAGKSSSKGESLLSFEAVIKSLTRTKESIGRATRIAIDCAKFGFATKVVEILAHNLESESSLHKKVDLFFLVDSITQCSKGMKGDGGIYPSAIQAMLPRLLLAAAPPSSSSHENHRQCLKVLRVWQERKILPEPIIRHHIRELDALCGPYPSGGSRRPLRNERAFDDPIREMEGMLVDEYGSNSSFQLPGFCMPPMLKDDDGGSDSDGESFEAVTPEHNVENTDRDKTNIPAVEKRSHILEDVDGELEMEDVAPCCEVDATNTINIAVSDGAQMACHQSDNHYGSSFTPQQPRDVQLTSAPLPRSPPPPLPPPPPPPPHSLPPSTFRPAVHDSVSNGPESKLYSSSQDFSSNVRESMVKQSVPHRVKSMSLDSAHHRSHNDRDFETQVPRQRFDGSNDCSFSGRTSQISGRVSNSSQPTDGSLNKGFHLRPPHPSPSNQFSYVQEQRFQSRRDIPPPSHSNRFHSRNSENGNFYRDRDRNKFAPRDNIGECWRPPLPSISGPSYHESSRTSHGPMSYSGGPREPPREPPFPNNRWNYPPRPTNHRHFNSYRPPSEGPIPVANRGPNFWRPR